MRHLLLSIIVFILSFCAAFEDVSGSLSSEGVYYSDFRADDFNSDGFPDFFFCGRGASIPVTRFFLGSASGFVDASAEAVFDGSLINVQYCSIASGDLDLDGYPDVLIFGQDSSFVNYKQVLRGQGNGSFMDETLTWGADIVPLGNAGSSSELGDYDGDGYLDLFTMGFTSGTVSTSVIYRFDPALLKFIAATNGELGLSLPQLGQGQGRWGDYDNDGWLDLVLGGAISGVGPRTFLLRNLGNGSFSDVSATALNGGPLPPSNAAYMAWGDADGDGDLDLAYFGFTSGPLADILVNTDGIFSYSGTALSVSGYSSFSWFDYDNDSDLDLLSGGLDGYIALYNNNGGMNFTRVTSLGFVDKKVNQLEPSQYAFDFDTDGIMDFVRIGRDIVVGDTSVFILARNNQSSAALRPALPSSAAPQNVQAVLDSENDTVTITWDVPPESENFTFLVHFRNDQVASPTYVTAESETSLLIPRFGNAGRKNFYLITGYTGDDLSGLHYSVQTISNDFRASPRSGPFVSSTSTSVSTSGSTETSSTQYTSAASQIASFLSTCM